MRKKRRRKPAAKWPYATIIILAICILAYVYLSGGEPYVFPLEKLDVLGVSLRTPWGALSYSFLHIGIKHLVGNALVILGTGLVAERMLGSRDTLGIYIASGVGAGLAYVFLYPNAMVLGSSAAISGLILAAYVVDIKKAFIVLAAALLLIPTFVYPNINAGLDWLEATRISQELQKSAEKQVVEQELFEVREQIEAGNYTPETIELEQNLTHLAEEIEVERKRISVKKKGVVIGRAREEATPVSFEIHVLGLVVALLYLLAYRRDSFSLLKKDFTGIWRWSLGIVKPRG